MVETSDQVEAATQQVRSVGKRLQTALGTTNKTEIARAVFGNDAGRAKLQTWLGLGSGARVSVPWDPVQTEQLLDFVEHALGDEERRVLESAWDVLSAISQSHQHSGSRAAHRVDAEDRIDSGDARLSMDSSRRKSGTQVGRWLQTGYPAPLISDDGVSAYFHLESDKTAGATPPYVERSGDTKLRERLHAALDTRPSDWEQRVVVLGGPAKAGKTRSLFEALRDEPALQAAEILIPMPPSAGPGRVVLDELAAALDRAEMNGLLGRAFVIFVDDLHRHFIEAGSANVQSALQRLIKRPSAPVLVASVSDGFLGLDDPAGDQIGVPRVDRRWLRETHGHLASPVRRGRGGGRCDAVSAPYSLRDSRYKRSTKAPRSPRRRSRAAGTHRSRQLGPSSASAAGPWCSPLSTPQSLIQTASAPMDSVRQPSTDSHSLPPTGPL